MPNILGSILKWLFLILRLKGRKPSKDTLQAQREKFVQSIQDKNKGE